MFDQSRGQYISTTLGSDGSHIIYSGTNATSYTTGALKIPNGGVSIGGNVYCNGTLYAKKRRLVAENTVNVTTFAGSFTISPEALLSGFAHISVGASDGAFPRMYLPNWNLM